MIQCFQQYGLSWYPYQKWIFVQFLNSLFLGCNCTDLLFWLVENTPKDMYRFINSPRPRKSATAENNRVPFFLEALCDWNTPLNKPINIREPLTLDLVRMESKLYLNLDVHFWKVEVNLLTYCEGTHIHSTSPGPKLRSTFERGWICPPSHPPGT